MIPKFACADFTFPLLSHFNALRLISMMGFEGVDIGLLEGRSHLQPSSEFINIEKNSNRLLHHLNELGLKAADVFLQCSTHFAEYAINQPETKRRTLARDWYLKALYYAKSINCNHITILPGVIFDNDYDRSFKISVEELQWRIEKANALGITLGIEVHVGSLVLYVVQITTLLNAVKGLTLTLDYTHFVRMGIPDQQYDVLLANASHLHMRNAAYGKLQTVSKENEIDFKRIINRVADINYKGFIGLEFVWTEWEDAYRVDNISETILLKRLMEKELDFILSKKNV